MKRVAKQLQVRGSKIELSKESPPVASDSLPRQDTSTIVKPYERLVLYVDSVTNLITYLGVVEPNEINTSPDETTSSDSLYIRAKRWAVKRFTGGAKALFDVDKRNIFFSCSYA